MDNLQEFLTLVGLVIGTIILVGGSLVLVRGSYNKARIQALREDVDDLQNRVLDRDGQLAECRVREDVLEQKVNHLNSENALLKAMVTQRANVDEVLAMLSDHHTAAMNGQAALTAAIKTLTEATR